MCQRQSCLPHLMIHIPRSLQEPLSPSLYQLFGINLGQGRIKVVTSHASCPAQQPLKQVCTVNPHQRTERRSGAIHLLMQLCRKLHNIAISSCISLSSQYKCIIHVCTAKLCVNHSYIIYSKVGDRLNNNYSITPIKNQQNPLGSSLHTEKYCLDGLPHVMCSVG